MATETEAGLTRSRLVKRAAIVGGAAIAWSTPFVTSASAADSSTAALTRTKCRTNGLNTTLRCQTCSQGILVCGTAPNGTTCFCFIGRSACCECTGNYFCDSAVKCTSNAGCPSGFKCVSSCCDDFEGSFTCAPPCGSGISSASSSGATAAG